MAGLIEKKALEVADNVAQDTGIFVVGAEYKKEGQDKVLRIFVDKAGGIGIDECEQFSRAFDAQFDKLDAIDEAYILEVSSPGIDRILKTEREFNYYLGREVEVKLYKAIDDKKEFVGILKDYNNEVAVVDTDGKEISIPVKEAVYIRLYFKF